MAATRTPTSEDSSPRLFSRAEAIAALKIGETTLFWLQRTGKLRPIRIGSRVLFNASEIMRIAAQGATLTESEKQAAATRDGNKIASAQIPEIISSTRPPPRRRGRPRKPPDPQDIAPRAAKKNAAQ